MRLVARSIFLVMLPVLVAGCQALVAGNSVATIDADLTMYAVESGAIREAATAEQTMVVETLIAASTKVAELSAVNAALGATLRANASPAPEVRAVVVSAEDMGSSLEDDMMDDEQLSETELSTMRVSNLAMAQGTDPNSGCSSGTVQQFSQDAELIYLTARVTSLLAGSNFSVDWLFEDRVVFRDSWRADYSKAFECIWFYATPEYFPFLPGSYSAILFVDGDNLGSTGFTIFAN